MKIILYVPVLALVVLTCGCASPYMVDRGRDAVDIFTVTAGVGAGGKGRVGPIQLGLFFNCAEVGVRGGGKVKTGIFEKSELGFPKALDVLCGAYGVELFEGSLLAPDRGKTFSAGTFCYLTAPVPESIIQGPTIKRATGRRASYSLIPYWTEIEAAVGLGGTLRLGFNPGELVDFVLGWTTLDIFSDDLELRNRKASLKKIEVQLSLAE